MDKAEKFRIGLFVAFALVGMFFLLKWQAHKDVIEMANAERYEACIQEQYGMHPIAYYDLHGSYPTCESTR